MSSATEQTIDALVVGAGFGGVYQLKKLRDQGLKTKLIDAASDVGGTWYWNRYPGAMSDTASFMYRYSWDLEDLRTYPWSNSYVSQKEVQGYLRHVSERHDLIKDMVFEAALESADWDEASSSWIVETSAGITFRTRYLVTALGILSKRNVPDIAGLSSFGGEKFHTAAWPENVALEGKRVGVIGNGSSGVQVVTAIAKDAKHKHLISFQRNPQYSVPSGLRPVPSSERQEINEKYPEIWKEAFEESAFAFGFKEASRKTFDVDEKERNRIYEEAWNKGGGFRFMFETFSDITTDEAANNAAGDFIKAKIREKVKDPEKARKLMPSEFYARRPLCDTGFYEQFNRENVDIVNLKETPIERITEKGILTSDGKEHELDVLIFATGFDSVDGSYTRLAIKGKEGTLKDYWSAEGPTSYLGVSVPSFPNLFMLGGPNGPFSNIPPALEVHARFISDLIESAEAKRKAESARAPVIEATREAEKGWTDLCNQVSAGSLFRKTESWMFAANIPGKKRYIQFWLGGLSGFGKQLQDIAAQGWKGYSITPAAS
ncbi:hypothetical protein HBI56_095380 [Parastagonospora nodorum]|nr:hypothetical protein HBH56_090690 [Parastagonospora nodorum]KAH3936665.1 hypothetical protein HBH54_025330 [Parastagonospora nodorum]KAH3945559.1 hypothetical protein HBH53_142430 [Parastagonospora nodorum]KAH3966646.1 hypothetical protein HBH51_142920 [Parastagonospora nodorum]KAH3989795.1 hypothetical protein HBH52_017940 [Parastagonospora nodorum]